jgi:hypothetical protein
MNGIFSITKPLSVRPELVEGVRESFSATYV